MSDLTAKKILITGATGFIGQHLLEALEGSNTEITILSRKQDPQLRSKIKATIIQGDIQDVETVLRAARDKDLIINLAGEIKKTDLFEKTNITGTKNLLSAAEANSVKKIIHLSSVGVVGIQYSSQRIVIDEKSECHPKNEYERTKLESENLVKEAATSGKIQAVILRPTNVFGEHHPENALLNLLSYCYKKRKIYFTLDAKVNYLYVKDLTAAILHFIEKDYDELIYNVGEPKRMDVFIESIEKYLNIPIANKQLPSFILGFMNMLPKKMEKQDTGSIE